MRSVSQQLGLLAVLVSVLCVWNGPAAAATCAAASQGAITLSTAAPVTASQCVLSVPGNDGKDFLSGLVAGTVFSGLSGGAWSLAGKSDEGADEVTAASTSDGRWAVAVPPSSTFVLVMKAGNAFSAFLFEGATGVTGGTYRTELALLRNGSGKGRDLSHLSLYEYTPLGSIGEGMMTTVVPLPAAGWLLLGGLGLLGSLKRRRA